MEEPSAPPPDLFDLSGPPEQSGYADVLDLTADGLATPLFAPPEFALRLTDLGIF